MKIALITGAAKGLGLGWCEQLGQRGYTLIVTARQRVAAEAAVRQLSKQHIEAHALVLDVSDEQSIQQAAAWTQNQFGQLDLLVNNAGINPKDYTDKARMAKAFRLDQLDFDEMAHVYRVNSLAPLMMVKHFRALLKSSPQPKVVNVSSWLGSVSQLSFGGHYGYVSSKNLLNVLNKSMALEIASDGIICLNVNPGWVKTQMGGQKAEFTPRQAVDNILQHVVDQATIEHTGQFFNYDGQVHPW